MNESPGPRRRDDGPYLRVPWPVVATGLVGVLGLLLALGMYVNGALRPRLGAQPAAVPVVVEGEGTLTATGVAGNVRATPVLTIGPLATPAALVVVLATPTPGVSISSTQTSMPTPQSTATAESRARTAPTITPELVAELETAYKQYWQIRAEALYTLDDSRIGEVMDDEHLKSVKRLIQDLRVEGRAIDTDIQHSYRIREATESEAKIHDSYVSNSVYIDVNSRRTLTKPAADRLLEAYELKRIAGVWKVVSLVPLQ
jgi:hypothetical protein